MRVAGLVLAAGLSTRMGRNKLLCTLDGKALVEHAVDAALDAGLAPVCVVTGHEDEVIRASLRGRALRFAHNPEHAQGMASSLRTGVCALGDATGAIDGAIDAVVVLLGDMPKVRAEHVARLLDAFERGRSDGIYVSEHAGQRGNPVLWPACDLPALAALQGDTGGRALLASQAERVIHVSSPDAAVLIDVDSPETLAQLRGGRC